MINQGIKRYGNRVDRFFGHVDFDEEFKLKNFF